MSATPLISLIVSSLFQLRSHLVMRVATNGNDDTDYISPRRCLNPSCQVTAPRSHCKSPLPLMLIRACVGHKKLR
jgi:hypothetical protein